MQQPTTKLAFEALISSYLASEWQQAHGLRQSLGAVDWIHYSYEAGDERRTNDMFFVADLDPPTALRLIRRQQRADNHLIFALSTRPNLVAEYMSEGCSYLAPPSYLMSMSLGVLANSPAEHEILRLSSAEQASIIETIEGAEPVSPVDLEDPRLSYYIALIDGRASAVARLSRLETGFSWVSHVYTAAPFRSQGLATALMNQLVKDSYDSGDRLMLLLATEEAHSLYHKLGFLDLAAVLNFILL